MITTHGFIYKKFNFPVGEMHLVISKILGLEDITKVDIEFEFERNEELVELLLLSDALKRNQLELNKLVIPYVPFSRQDRINIKGECFSLKVFADIVNSCNAKEVVITDPHSDVTTTLINNYNVITQEQLFEKHKFNANSYLISPDGGALKKIYKLAKKVKLPVIECSKQRNVENGEITGIKINATDLEKRDCYIVDDICDGGRTFIEIAKELKNLNSGKIILLVSHGFFTKGLKVFDDLIDEIYTRKGKVK
jgi:ribose-phosphate pyrophosphokinase